MVHVSSILNTEGEQWTSCQTILSVLLTISSILQNNLILEPGVKLSHPDVNRYNDIITYKNLDFCVKDIVIIALNLKDENHDKSFKTTNELRDVISMFKNDIISNFKKYKNDIFKVIDSLNSQSISRISSRILWSKMLYQL